MVLGTRPPVERNDNGVARHGGQGQDLAAVAEAEQFRRRPRRHRLTGRCIDRRQLQQHEQRWQSQCTSY